jgi:hypothetical protein
MGDLTRIETKIDKLDEKVDTLISSEARNSEAINWLKGHVHITTILVISALGWLTVQYLT